MPIITQPSLVARRRAHTAQQIERHRNFEETTRRLIEAYRHEPDQEYAEYFWGGMLRERGFDLEDLNR